MNVLRKITLFQNGTPCSLIQLGILAAILVGLLAVSSQSLWIDEGNTALKVIQPTWMGFVSSMASELGSDVQMPLYMALLWAWEKVFGPSEFALRAFNIPWLLIAVWSLGQLREHSPGLKVACLGVLLTSPFVWYYLNEARPYAMQIGASFLSFVGLFNILDEKCQFSGKREIWMFTVGCLLLSGSSLIGMLISGLLTATLLLSTIFGQEVFRAEITTRFWWLPALVSAPFFFALLFYYFWTLSVGAKASPLGSAGLMSILFAAYEFLGFAGLGPNRLKIRDLGFSAFIPYLLPLGIMAGALMTVLASAAHPLRKDLRSQTCKKAVLVGGFIALATTSFLLVVSGIAGFRLLGRHFTPIYPLIVFLGGFVICAAWKSRVGRMAVLLAFVFAMASSLSLRFHKRHAKEDYRSAAKIATAAIQNGDTVWWAADRSTGVYYGVHFKTSENFYGAIHLFNPTNIEIENLPHPNLIVLSKPNVYDQHFALRHALENLRACLHDEVIGFRFYTVSAGTP